MLNFVHAIYTKIIKPIYFSMAPDKAHEITINMMEWAGRQKPLRALAKKMFGQKYPQLYTKLNDVEFTSPVGIAAGLDKNGQATPIISCMGFGFSEVGSVTAEKCAGNAKPWFFRLPNSQSLVVHAGLANYGVKAVLQNIKENSKYYSPKFPVILSVARNNSPCVVTDEQSIADYVTSVKQAEKSKKVNLIEINISCPNAFGGESFTRPEAFAKLLKAIANLKPKKPLIIKMPSDLNWADFKKLIDIALKYNVKIFAISNLAKDRKLITKDELPNEIKGGLSGKPLQKISDDLIKKTYKEYGKKITIIGIGGIFNAKDAYRKIKLGASYVELITGMIFEGPQLAAQINQELVELLQKDGYKHLKDAVGKDVK